MFRRVGVKVWRDVIFAVIDLRYKLLQRLFEFALLIIAIPPFLQPFLPFLLLILKES